MYCSINICCVPICEYFENKCNFWVIRVLRRVERVEVKIRIFYSGNI